LDTQRVLADPQVREPYPQDQPAKDYFYDGSEPDRTWPVAGHNLDDTMWPWNGTKSLDTPHTSLPPWNQPGGALERRPRNFLDHVSLGYVYDTEIGWERVRDILDNILFGWEARVNRRQKPNSIAGHRGPWATKQGLLAAKPYGQPLVAPDMIGKGKGSQTNLIIALRESNGVGGTYRMPLGSPYLAEHQIEIIRVWIDAGCPD